MTKQKTDYEPHDSMNLDEGWDAVREYLRDAVAIAYDGCHKIYLAMDEAEADWFRTYYRSDDDNDPARFAQVADADEAYEMVSEWWDGACSLRFVSAVWHDEEDPNAGFVRVIDQCARWADEDEES
jgi:hypothetical protein